MNTKMTSACLGLAAAACVALTAQTAQAADCSDEASTFLDLAGATSGLIPTAGSVASAGFSILGTLVCEDETPISEEAVVGLIRNELDGQALTTAGRNIHRITGDMEAFARDLSLVDPSIRFESPDPTFVGETIEEIEAIEGDIFDAESDFFGPFSTTNNARTSYDLRAAILLANYKLTLAQLRTSLVQDGDTAEFNFRVAERILLDFEEFRAEADRLRGMELVTVRKATRSRVEIYRSGRPIGVSEQDDYPFYTTDKYRDDIEERLRDKLRYDVVIPLLDQLDAQEQALLAVEARAQAMFEDPFVSLSTVEVPSYRGVFLRSVADGARNRCLFNDGGRVTLDANGAIDRLQDGKSRTRQCDARESMQQWRLLDNGNIQSSVGDLCLTAQDYKSVVEVQPCEPDNERQVWTRHGDQLRVEVDGTTTCMMTSPDGANRGDREIRHFACNENDGRQRWLVFSQLRHGRPVDLSSIDPQAFASLEDFQTLARSGPDLCPQEFASGAFALEVCTRNSAAFWAHDTAGRLHKFSFGSSVETRAIHPSEIDTRIAVSDQGGLAFTREESRNGAVTFTVVDDERMLFPGASERFAVMFLDAPLADENGELDELMYWQHFNGGKFAE